MTTESYRPQHPIRFVTAASLFDGHDASINLFRRLLQSNGVEVIHLGHDRSVDLIVDTALQEDVQGIAVSSYQGGHMEFFKYMIDRLKDKGADHIRVFAPEVGASLFLRRLRRWNLTVWPRCFLLRMDARWGCKGLSNI